MQIREADESDLDLIWPVFSEVVKAGDTYAYDPYTTKSEALAIWFKQVRKTYLVQDDGEVVATYYLKTNQHGPGQHVCNCGYMVAESARGKGYATAMCEHSQQQARELGYSAMQFNLVASTNAAAVRLWLSLGFAEVGRLPLAFNHPERGLVDALVMYKTL